MLPTLPIRRSVLAGALVAALTFFIPVRPAITLGRSMEPTLQNGQPFLFSTQTAAMQPLKRGDIVVLRIKRVPSVKRIVALGGDVLWLVPQSSEVGGAAWALAPGEELAVWRKRYPWMEIRRYVVPDGSVYVVGDSPYSEDSRQLGAIRRDAVMGRVTWPSLPQDMERSAFFHRLIEAPKRPMGRAKRHAIRIARG